MSGDGFVLRVLSVLASNDGCDDVWWRTDGEYAPVTFLVNCNDVFFWGCADAEHVTRENVDELERAYADCRAASGHPTYGAALFCARLRKERPQGAAYPKEPKLWPLFDACGPERAVGLGNPRKHPRDCEATP